jgi:hypothetical protein
MNPQELSMTLWAFATLGAADPALMLDLGAAAAHKADAATAQQMATSAHALAKAGLACPRLLHVYQVQARSRRALFGPRDVAFLAWAYAKLEVRAPDLFRLFSEVACALLRQDARAFAPQHLTMLLWSFGMLQEAAGELLASATAAMAPMLDEFNPRDLTNTAWALDALGCVDAGLVARIGQCAVARLAEFNSQELLKLLGCLERLGGMSAACAAAFATQRQLRYEFPALALAVELAAATPKSYDGSGRVRVDDSCGGGGRGNTGVALWEGSFVLAEWLSRQALPENAARDLAGGALSGAWGSADRAARWEGKVGVELGAGLGLPSIVVSNLGVRMIATDGPHY